MRSAARDRRGRSRAAARAPAPLGSSTASPAGGATAMRVFTASSAASRVSQRNRSLTWIMPRGSSSVSLKSGMRETPASPNVRNSSASVSLSSSAMMSARGTMMSSTREPPKRSSRRSISRSSLENAAAASASASPLRSASSISRRLGERRPMRLRSALSRLCVPLSCSPPLAGDGGSPVSLGRCALLMTSCADLLLGKI